MARICTIVVSTADAASVNIRDRLFELAPWEKAFDSDYRVYSTKGFQLVEIGDYHVFQDGLDDKLEGLGFKPEAIIFASKHRSKENRRTLTVHFTGNVAEGKFGGRPGELAVPAPHIAVSLLKSLKSAVSPFAVSYEATHHGPSSLKTPSVYVEIGSTMEEWSDKAAGKIIAWAILNVDEEAEEPVFVGIGGNHYAPRETALALEANVAFGHIIPDHAVPSLTEDVLKQAFEKSGTRMAYLDRKSIPKAERGRIERIIEQLGCEIHAEGDIRDLSKPLLKCPRLLDITRSQGPALKLKATKSLLDAVPGCRPGSCDACPMGIRGEVNEELLDTAWKTDKAAMQQVIDGQNVAYFMEHTGMPYNVFAGVDKDAMDRAVEAIMRACIGVVKKRYTVKYDHWEELLYVIDRRFDPARAKALGVPEGPLYGRLAKGEAVVVQGATITPQMVTTENVKRIK